MPLGFCLLALSICAVWLAPVRVGGRLSVPPWLLLFACSITAGLAEAFLTWPALVGLGAFGFAAWMTGRPASGSLQRAASGVLTALLALALALHMLPGFHNPLLVADARFSADAAPFTQYANFDKASVGLILLAMVARRAGGFVERRMVLLRITPVALLTIAVTLGASVVAGYVKPDLKLPSYTPVFLVTNLLFVCVAEEAFFRGFLQERLSRALSGIPCAMLIAVACSALLFGLAHLGGGLLFAGIATIAGLGYAYAYAVSGRIEAPILLHFGLNAVHFIGFTYPRLL